MNPLDWTGPEFLKLYVGVLVATGFLALLIQWLMRYPSGESVADKLENSPYEAAFLAGGAQAAVDAATVRLIRLGTLALDATELRLTRKNKERPGNLHPLEASVFEAVDAETGSLLGTVRRRAAAEAEKLRPRLEQLGLLIPTDRAVLVRLVPVLVLLATALLGGAKIAIGVSRDRPVGFLIILVSLSVAAAVGVGFLPAFRSRRGDATLAKLKHDNAALEFTAGRRSNALTDDDLVMALGLFGVGVLAGGPLGHLPTPFRAAQAPRITSSSSSSCSSCGSSCGGGGGGCGGGCGGGGCGGCGG